MADKPNPIQEHEHESFFERILHHHGGNKGKDDHNDKESQQPQGKQEDEMDKLKDYFHEDKQLEEEGHEYGDLM
ncbi:hypothetical protein PENDEC_c037G01292 [Penicillium decumbens]|uniref:Uncharacterized protein n=1 Tax=Penicillium decumbens TaxID=69771 RepID=A0A1V6NS22_PENDC|nr:hypothetical protein PENDEC_c037G01292 [Penicillium decumbens]